MGFAVLQLQFVLTSFLQLNGNTQLYEVLVEFETLVKNKDYASGKLNESSVSGSVLGYNFRSEL